MSVFVCPYFSTEKVKSLAPVFFDKETYMIENIYYMIFSVLPTKQNQEYDNIKSAMVYCWIKSTDVQSSYIEATFFIEKSD